MHPQELGPQYILWLSILATVGLAVMWATFWRAVTKRQESVKDVLLSPAFFRTVTVMGVIAATVVLSLAGRLADNIAGTMLSGIVGYVLGRTLDDSKSATQEK
jgi:RsiW-degrading membrane proteinase PrsW (M82 family)